MVKIQLENFLCHQNATFDLGEDGLSLISGRSGKGKTSILKGIFFALFGSGSKLQTYGKKSAKVTLEFEDLKIVRTKSPNRLILNDKYEDKAAQEIINKKFGKAFETSGYARQNNLSSFILLSPTDKLFFLEKFAFENINLREIKAKCKAHIASSNKSLISATSQLEMVTQILEETEKPEFVKCPLKCRPKNREKVIKNENIRLKNSIILTKKHTKTKKKLEKQLTNTKILGAVLSSNNHTLEKVKSKLDAVMEEKEKIHYIGDEALEILKEKIKQITQYKNLIELQGKYEDYKEKLAEMRERESDRFHKSLTEIKEGLWDQYSQEETKETITELENCLTEMNEYQKIQRKLDSLEITEDSEVFKNRITELEDKLQNLKNLYDKIKLEKESYTCPCCNAKLKLQDSTLIEVQLDKTVQKGDNIEDVKEQIKSLRNSLESEKSSLTDIIMLEKRHKELETRKKDILKNYENLPNIEEVKEDLDYMREYLLENKNMEKKYSRLEERGPYSETCKEFSIETENIGKKVKKLSELYKDCKIEEDEESIRKKINEEQNNKIMLYTIKQSCKTLNSEIEDIEKIIEKAKKSHIKKYSENLSVDEIEKKIEIKDKEIENCEKTRKTQLAILEEINVWKDYEKEEIKYNSWKEKITKLKEIERVASQKHASFLQLKEKILQAESISLQNIIDSINSHARLYLDDFFPEDPISVELHAFKESKKKTTKPSINIRIEYKSMECNLNMLSGGELARVVLAYTLALAEMFNTPLILLDECTASLDQEMTGVVFDSIKDHFNGKLAVIIAHQVVSGVFDKVLIL